MTRDLFNLDRRKTMKHILIILVATGAAGWSVASREGKRADLLERDLEHLSSPQQIDAPRFLELHHGENVVRVVLTGAEDYFLVNTRNGFQVIPYKEWPVDTTAILTTSGD